MGDCRGHLLSEFDVDADDVDRLLERRSVKCERAKRSSAHDWCSERMA